MYVVHLFIIVAISTLIPSVVSLCPADGGIGCKCFEDVVIYCLGVNIGDDIPLFRKSTTTYNMVSYKL